MTTPGGSNVGTAYGKVRIDYESTGVAKAVKDVEALQKSLVSTGSTAQGSAKQVSKAQGQIVASAQAAVKALEKGINVSAPINITPKEVKLDGGAIEKAIQAFKQNKKQTINVGAPVRITSTKVDIDKGSITRAIESFAKTQSTQRILIKAPVEVQAGQVTLDRSAIENAVRTARLGQLTVTAPIHINPSQVTVDQGALSSATQQINGTISSGAQQGGSALAGGLVGGLSKGLLLRAGPLLAAGGALGLVFAKGFSRLQGLDQAAVKLKALGKSTEEIAAISKSALDSVDQTAFGLDEAFGQAANAISVGIKPGKELDAYLNSLAGTAALANTSMTDLGDAFATAAVEGKLTGDVVDMLASRQVPVLQLIADEYGVTQKKAQEMVSNSEVSFDRFISAMGKNKTAAKEMSNTVGGSFSNLMASVSRIGAMLLEPLFGKANGEASLFAKGIQFVTDKLKDFEGFLKSNRSAIITTWEFAGKAVLTWGHVTINMIGWVVEGIGKLIEGIGHVPSAFAGIFDTFGAHGIADNLRGASDNMTRWGTATFEAGQKIHGAEKWINNAWDSLEKYANEARQSTGATDGLGNSAAESGPKLESLAEALDKAGAKAKDVQEAIFGSVQQFKDLIESLEKSGASKALVDSLKNLRREYDNGGRAADSYARAIENLGDQSIDASTKAKDLVGSLQKLGLLPGGNELDAYEDAFRDLARYDANLVDQLEATGNALVNLDGTFNTSLKNADTLKDHFDSIRDSAYALAASGTADPGEVYDETVRRLKFLAEQYGITGETADTFIQNYLSPGGGGKVSFESQFAPGHDPKSVIENAFKDDPAKLNSILDLLTTRDDIINEITGGPGSTLKIPAELEISNPPGKPGENGVYGPPHPDNPPAPPTPPSGPGAATTVPTPNGPKTVPGLPLPGQSAGPTGIVQPTDLGGLLGAPGSNYDLTQQQRDALLKIATNQGALDKAFAENPDIAGALQPIVDQAKAQGQNMGIAFAQGLMQGNQEVKDALLELAQLAPDILGNSPAKYGPLSGRGWTLYRGQNFAKAYGEGIASQSNSVKAATASMAGAATVPFADQIEKLVGDLQDLSDFGKLALDFANQIGEIGFNAAKLANDLSGGRLFPKSYIADPNAKPGSAFAPGNLTRFSPPGSINAGARQGGSPTAAPGALGQNASKQQIADYIINKAMSLGYSRKQADDFVIQAFGESGLNPAANGGNQNGSGDVRGIFQFTPDTWGNRAGSMTNAQDNIDAYFDLAAQRGLTPENFTAGSQLGTQVSIGGPWHPQNAQKGHLSAAKAGAQQYLDAFGGPSTGTTTSTQPTLAQAASGLQLSPWGDAGYFKDRKTGDVYREVGGKYYRASDLKNDTAGKPVLDANGMPLARTSATTGQTPTGATGPVKLPSGGSQNTNAAIGYLEQIAAQYGLKLTSGKRDWAGTASGKSFHLSGEAGDFAVPGVNVPTENKRAFAEYVKNNMAQYVKELIYSDDQGGVNLYDGKPHQYSASTLAEHRNHVHVAIQDAMVAALANGDLPGLPETQGAQPNSSVGQAGSVTDLLSRIAGNTDQLPTLPKALEQFGPALANLPKTQDEAKSYLQNIDGLIADQNRIGTPQSKLIADQLGKQRSNVMSQFGLTEGQSGLDQAQNIANGISSIASGLFATFDTAIKSIASAKDISGTLVRGISNTEDIMNVIDNVQTFIELGQRIAQNVSDISGFAASLVGAAGSGDTSGASQGVAMALGAVSGISGMVSQIFAAVNTGIDLAQSAYRLTTKYMGRFLTQWFGFPGASDMKFLLDEQTGQLQAYTSDNPQMKHTFNTLGRQLGAGGYSDRQPPQNNFTIYQGPGQDPRDTMDDAMFTVRSSGVGAFGYAD